MNKIITIETKEGKLIERNAKVIGKDVVVGNIRYELVARTIGLYRSAGLFKTLRIVTF